MSSHNVRQDIAAADAGVLSSTNGELLALRDVYGAHYIIVGTNGDTRKLPAPGMLGQKIYISARITTGALTINAPSGTTFDGADDQLTFTFSTDQETSKTWCVLEAFDVGGVLSWRVTAKGAGVTYT